MILWEAVLEALGRNENAIWGSERGAAEGLVKGCKVVDVEHEMRRG